ncbi:4-coumarate--CoA ligase (photoactive yellow protein activation family) [Paraburkholderia sp. GAS33]|jgi:4-coumarate--CoA ligase (photoactive yellow protein activation family)|uniref:AMP-binding protein n=1 Tax=Paraburkholderia sp. GAS33 TaxID=3035130 RepID=UPI003D1C70DA
MIALHDLLVSARADHTPVCRDADTVLDFAFFRARTLRLAAALRAQPAKRYALCLDDPFDFACTLFALLASGKEPVIPANATPGYLADLADAYDCLFTAADLATLEHEAAREDEPADTWAIDPFARLTLFTSGSSGAPKPVHKTLAQFNAEVHTLEKQWGDMLGEATVLASVPHHHIYGILFRVFWPLAAGRALDRTVSTDPQALQARIAQCGAAVVVSTPAQLSRWPDLPAFATLTPAPLAFFSSGGPLAAETARQYAERFGAAPLEVYGSTETGGIAWRQQNKSDAWRAMPGILVQRAEDGALSVRSPHLGHDEWHRTDDEAAFDSDGRFRLLGRLDRVIKLDGKRLSLAELEARIAQHPFVAQVAVTRLTNASRERAGAVVVLTEAGIEALRTSGRVALVKTLRRHLAAYFDLVVLPRHWRFRLALPFDARGKLPAAALAATFEARADGVEVLAEARQGDVFFYELHVPHTLVHFAGHFPGLPILPGVVQVDWAIKLAAVQVPAATNVASIDRLKFMAPVPPGAQLKLTLTHDASRQRIQFNYRLGERDCASGAIVYREPA